MINLVKKLVQARRLRATLLREKSIWDVRINDVLACPDNLHIPRHPQAGLIVEGRQVMHNGLTISQGCYYGDPIRRMLEENRGVHEPQEERVFYEILKLLPDEATMLELGSYWAFYSMWFYQDVKKPHCYLCEPNVSNLESGKQNFEAHKMSGAFINAYISDYVGNAENGVAIKTVDSIVEQNNIDHIDILHSDVQGAEFEMLQGALRSFSDRKISYVFVSTHTAGLHEKCLSFLKHQTFTIVASANMSETYSYDGLIVASAPHARAVQMTPISLKPPPQIET